MASIPDDTLDTLSHTDLLTLAKKQAAELRDLKDSAPPSKKAKITPEKKEKKEKKKKPKKKKLTKDSEEEEESLPKLITDSEEEESPRKKKKPKKKKLTEDSEEEESPRKKKKPKKKKLTEDSEEEESPRITPAYRKQMLEKIAKKATKKIQSTAHNDHKKPYSEIVMGMDFKTAIQLMGDHGEIKSDTYRMQKRIFNCEQILAWLPIERIISPCRFNGKIICMAGDRPVVAAHCTFESLEVKADKKQPLLTLKFRTFMVDATVNYHGY